MIQLIQSHIGGEGELEQAEDVETGILQEVACDPAGNKPCSIIYLRDDPSGRGTRVQIFLQTPHGRDHDCLEQGSTVHAYHGFHGEVRGLIVNGNSLWMLSERESSERLLAGLRAEREKKEALDDAACGSLEERWEALPEPIRAACGPCEDTRKFRRLLFLAEEAVKILEACPTREAVQHFASAPPAEQHRSIPTLSPDHSGSTFADAVALALRFSKYTSPDCSLE